MIQLDKKEHAKILEESIEYLEKKGFENIKADLDGYETPKSFSRQGSDLTVTPDIVAHRDDKKHYFEVSVKTEKPKILKSKWLILDTLSRLKKQRFKIITVRGHYKFTNEILSELNLEKNLIKLN